MKARSLFATELFHSPLGLSKKSLADMLKDLEKIQTIDKKGHQWSKKNYAFGYTSYSSLDRLFEINSSFLELKNRIDKQAIKFAKHLQFDLSKGTLHMTHLWANVQKCGGGHSFHIHPKACLSGTFYLQVPKGSGGLKIEDPRLQLFMNRPPLNSSGQKIESIYTLIPRPGDLVLFESWLRHEVPVNLSKSKRVSLSFNYAFVEDL